jgi:hypothetical protein
MGIEEKDQHVADFKKQSKWYLSPDIWGKTNEDRVKLDNIMTNTRSFSENHTGEEKIALGCKYLVRYLLIYVCRPYQRCD